MRQYDEIHFVRPLEIVGAKASDQFGALELGIPQEFKAYDLGAALVLMKSLTSFTFRPLCDKQSGNILQMKVWGYKIENVVAPAVRFKVLFYPEHCGLHIHQRGKLQLPEISFHIARHFSSAHLFRLYSVRSIAQDILLQDVKNFLVRHVGPPPEGTTSTFTLLADMLVDLEAAHHHRKRGDGESARVVLLRKVGRFYNSDLIDEKSNEIDVTIHYCWEVLSARPCCSSERETHEKGTSLLAELFYGGNCGQVICAKGIWRSPKRWSRLLLTWSRLL